MCKHIDNYFTMVVDEKESVVVIPRNYKGEPMLAYSPNILIITEQTLNKFRSSILCDFNKTRVVFLDG